VVPHVGDASVVWREPGTTESRPDLAWEKITEVSRFELNIKIDKYKSYGNNYFLNNLLFRE
jgi:hypothetical protein